MQCTPAIPAAQMLVRMAVVIDVRLSRRQTMQNMLATDVALPVMSNCMCNPALQWHQLDNPPILCLRSCLSLTTSEVGDATFLVNRLSP